MKFTPPFQVQDGVIYDREGRKVKLWGVNYYAPFNHNYYNIAELGKDHFSAIDEDIRHFKLLGVELVRMHLYDREITDRTGNVVENHNMKVFDYLVDQCEKNGIFLMLSPTVWWNTVKNQIMQEAQYAFWFTDARDDFGFSNFYSCDSMLWDPEAIRCQQVYLEGLLSRRNAFSGRRLDEYPNLVVFELFNEPRYPEKWQLEKDCEITPANMGAATLSRGAQRLKLVAIWEEFRAAHPEEPDGDRCFSLFRAAVVRNYFDSLFPILDKYFGNRVIRAQFPHYTGVPPVDLQTTFEAAGIDAYSIGTYLNVNAFDAENTDSANHLALALEWFRRFGKVDFGKIAKVSYEFDATATLNGYPLAAIAAMYARHDVQIAAYFTYTPAAVAAWNPGWLVHFLSIGHTPSRAAGFAAAGEIFRNHNPGDAIEMEENAWRGSDYAIERKNDFVFFRSDTVFRYSNSNDLPLGDAGKLELVSGRGDSRWACCGGNGFFHMEKLDGCTWRLVLFPNQQYVSAPGRGKAYRCMANRYVNCLKEPPVSILKEEAIPFRLKAFPATAAKRARTGESVAPENGVFRLAPGEYILSVSY